MKWDNELIERIRTQKEREKSEDRDALLHLVGVRLYGEKVHYALELIQNAEDEGASSVTFIFDRDHAVVINDGEPFDAEDVWGICSVRPGRKKNKIGFFGIGFKSVFTITQRPQIVSRNYNFAVEKMVYPHPGDPLPSELHRYYHPDKGSIFILPYSANVPDPNELITKFNELDEKLLLFLDQVRCISFIDRVNDDRWEIVKEPIGRDNYALIHPKKAAQKSIWKVFHKTLDVDPKEVVIPFHKVGIEQTRLTVAFPCDEETANASAPHIVYCYLPTKQRTDLPFLIQADFVPIVGRQYIAEDPWNNWLLVRLGDFAADSIEDLSDSELKDHLLDFIPLEREVQDLQIQILHTQMTAQLKEKRIAETPDERFITPLEAAFPRDERVRQLLTEKDLNTVLQEKRRYVKPHLDNHAKEVLEALDAFPVDEAEVIAFIQQESRLRHKKEMWFLDLYDFLASYFGDATKSYLWTDWQREHFEAFARSRCILTAQGRLVAPKDMEHPDRMICYAGIGGVAELVSLFSEDELVILHPFFQEASITGRRTTAELEEKRKRVKDFLDTLGIRKHFRQYHVINQIILPKFTTGRYRSYDDATLYRYLDYIRTNLGAYESEGRKSRPSVQEPRSIYRPIIDSVLVKSLVVSDGEKTGTYRKPSELCFSRAYGKGEVMQHLFEGVDGVAFLSPYYANREKRDRKKAKKEPARQREIISWRRFFEILGGWSCPRLITLSSPFSISGKQGYEWVNKRYSPRGEHELIGDSDSPDLRALLHHLAKEVEAKMSRERLELLWAVLEKNWNKVYKAACGCIYQYSYYGWNPIALDTSSFLELLRGSTWVPTSSDMFAHPGDVYLDTKRNRHLMGDDVAYTKLEGNKTFLNDLGVHIEPSPADAVEHLRNLRKDDDGKRNMLEECRTIYAFLRDHVAENPEDEVSTQNLSELFASESLLYLPRIDRRWWPPSAVFWQNFFGLFGINRGYIEHNGKQLYPNDLKDFLLSLQVHERPSISDCLEFLSDLTRETNMLKRLAPALYLQIEHLCNIEAAADVEWSKDLFLSHKGEFLPPNQLYTPDDDEYVRLLADDVDVVWLPFLPASIPHFLKAAGFVSLAEHVQVSKEITEAAEFDSGIVTRIVTMLGAVEAYLRDAHPNKHAALQQAGALELGHSLSMSEAKTIRVSYTVRHLREGHDLTAQEDRDVFLSHRDNRLYITPGVDLFSTEVAKELSKIYRGAETEAFSFLDAMMQTKGDSDALRAKLLVYNIDLETYKEDEESEKVRLLQETLQEPAEPQPLREEEKPRARREDEKPAVTPEIQVPTGLINPDEYVEDEEEEREPYAKAETEVEPAVKKKVKLKSGRPSTERPQRKLTFKTLLSKLSVEQVALELALRHEEERGNTAEDRHNQRWIGYDVYSVSQGGTERFIEVKGFREDNGILNLTATEWAKAEEARNNYFVYIFTGLRAGGTPTLWEIENPTKLLSPDPPQDKHISKWQHAVKRKITFKKV